MIDHEATNHHWASMADQIAAPSATTYAADARTPVPSTTWLRRPPSQRPLSRRNAASCTPATASKIAMPAPKAASVPRGDGCDTAAADRPRLGDSGQRDLRGDRDADRGEEPGWRPDALSQHRARRLGVTEGLLMLPRRWDYALNFPYWKVSGATFQSVKSDRTVNGCRHQRRRSANSDAGARRAGGLRSRAPDRRANPGRPPSGFVTRVAGELTPYLTPKVQPRSG